MTIRALHLVALFLCASPLLAGTNFTPDVPDVEVVTHEGRTVHFYSDLVKGRVVAVNFIFTNCSTICPASGALFANLQKQSDRGVQFISISIDPATDTPKKLEAWSRQFRTNPRWTLVTGKKSAIDQLVKAFGATLSRPQDHQPLIIIGSDTTHIWTRLYGMPGSDKVNALVDDVMKEVVAAK
jgi:protein SCO1/2